jgi:hypothetical protein
VACNANTVEAWLDLGDTFLRVSMPWPWQTQIATFTITLRSVESVQNPSRRSYESFELKTASRTSGVRANSSFPRFGSVSMGKKDTRV